MPVVALLIATLKNDEREVKLHDIFTLGMIMDSRSVEPLFTMLRHEKDFV